MPVDIKNAIPLKMSVNSKKKFISSIPVYFLVWFMSTLSQHKFSLWMQLFKHTLSKKLTFKLPNQCFKYLSQWWAEEPYILFRIQVSRTLLVYTQASLDNAILSLFNQNVCKTRMYTELENMESEKIRLINAHKNGKTLQWDKGTGWYKLTN